MKSVFSTCRKITSWAFLCFVISIAGASNAQALNFFGFGGAFLCGPTNTSPTPVHITTTGGLRVLTATVNTTVLLEQENGLRKLQQHLFLTSKDPSGKVVWSRNFFQKSKGLAQVFPGAGYILTPTFQYDPLNVARQFSPILLFNWECMGLGVAQSGANKYVIVALGTQAATGTPASGKDLSIVNIWVLNKNTGVIVKVFRPRPIIGRYFLGTESGVYDIDNDGSDELVLVYGKFIGDQRYDFVYEYYNLQTGVRKNIIRTNQFNRLIIK